jgi:putative addiction module CopG family antidote
MVLTLKPEQQRFVDEQIKQGNFASAEAVVDAALRALSDELGQPQFAQGELDRLIAEGMDDLANGRVHDGEEVFAEMEQLSAARRGKTA